MPCAALPELEPCPDALDWHGSHRHRHQSIGAGEIGAAGFGGLLRHPLTDGVPFVVQTPGGERGHARNTAVLRALLDGDTLRGDTGHHGVGPSPGSS